ELLTSIISEGQSSRFQKEIVDKQQKAVQALSFAFPLEDPGMVLMFGIANMGINADDLEKAMQTEIDKIVNGDLTEAEFKKALSKKETALVNKLGSVSNVAEKLATNYTYFRNTNLINNELAQYQKISLEDLKRVAKKYLVKDKSLVVHYLPKAK